MIESIKNVWLTLRGMNIYLEVTLAAFAAYFWIRHMMEMDVKKAVWLPIIVCILGQAAYALKDIATRNDHFGLDDAVMVLFMALFQAGIASMIYSIAEKYGWIDKLGAMVGKKIDGGNNAPNPPSV